MSDVVTTSIRVGNGPEVPIDLNKDINDPTNADAKKQLSDMFAKPGDIAADQLRLFIERIERLEEEKKGIAEDISDVYREAKANGYDTRTIREVIKLRKLEAHARQERGALLATYANALQLDLGL